MLDFGVYFINTFDSMLTYSCMHIIIDFGRSKNLTIFHFRFIIASRFINGFGYFDTIIIVFIQKGLLHLLDFSKHIFFLEPQILFLIHWTDIHHLFSSGRSSTPLDKNRFLDITMIRRSIANVLNLPPGGRIIFLSDFFQSLAGVRNPGSAHLLSGWFPGVEN